MFLHKSMTFKQQGQMQLKLNFSVWNHGQIDSPLFALSNDTKFMLLTRCANDFTYQTVLITPIAERHVGES